MTNRMIVTLRTGADEDAIAGALHLLGARRVLPAHPQRPGVLVVDLPGSGPGATDVAAFTRAAACLDGVAAVVPQAAAT